ncbi:MAG: FtsW/RodA/SpoVE family cell cycle protein [Anaerovoracaceae bacterium]
MKFSASKSSRRKAKKTGEKNIIKDRVHTGLIGRLLTWAKVPFAECNRRIVIAVIALTCFGIVMVFSAGFYSAVSVENSDPYQLLKKQTFFAVTGFGLLVAAANYDYHKYSRRGNLIAAFSLALLLLLFTPLGVKVNGATRWLYLGMRITPSEISKVCMILWTAVYFARYPGASKRWRNNGLLTVLIMMVIHAALIMWQPNLSTAIVVCAIMVAIAIVAGMNLGYIGGIAAIGALGTAAILTFGKNTHWYSRITSFLDPFADSQGSGYQVSQGIIALGNGGLTGLGWGNSVAKNLYLPEPQNDFILAIIGEELGYIRVIILILVYMYLIYQCVMVGLKARDKLGLYISTGVTVMLALHVILNVAVVTSSMPATGITLPFVSYGGTSLWMFMTAMGILLNVSRGQSMTPLVRIKVMSEKEKRERRKKRNS